MAACRGIQIDPYLPPSKVSSNWIKDLYITRYAEPDRRERDAIVRTNNNLKNRKRCLPTTKPLEGECPKYIKNSKS